MPRPASKRRHASLSARTADKHELYQQSVQVPEADIRFFERVYRGRHGRLPTRLREDFGGTAYLASAWVKKRTANLGWAVDIDAKPLAWGDEHNRRPLGAAASRLSLVQGDVRSAKTPGCDVVVAMNFSFFCFKTRAELVAYFRAARGHLAPGGIFFADAFGGPEAMIEVEEKRRKSGFTYVWEQRSYDPITGDLATAIHFDFPDGSRMTRAFTYEWRLWNLPELVDCLHDGGFSRVRIFWETTDAKGDGTGIYREAAHASPCESFVCCIAAEP
jgi:hypothetical protein